MQNIRVAEAFDKRSANSDGWSSQGEGAYPFARQGHDEPITSNAYQAAALAMLELGLAPIPAGGDEGKDVIGVSRWNLWRRPPARALVSKLVGSHGGLNVGTVTGPASRITVVDLDPKGIRDPKQMLADALARYGETPLIVETPSGGFHLYYRHSGEGCPKPNPGVEMKGAGGYVVTPPSVRVSGEHKGKAYRFKRGSWADLPSLPATKPAEASPSRETVVPLGKRVPEGNRNEALFRYCLRQAPSCDNEAALIDVAETFADEHCEAGMSPIGRGEVIKTARSAWRFQVEGRNVYAGHTGWRVDLDAFDERPEAYLIFEKLKRAHSAREEPFAFSPKALADSQFVSGKADWRWYARVRDFLEENEFLVRVQSGGRRKGDPHLFRLGRGQGA